MNTGKNINSDKNMKKDKVFTIFGANANGILGKQESLKKNILHFNPAVFFKIMRFLKLFAQTVLQGGLS